MDDENLILLLDAANRLECEKVKHFISQYIFNRLNMKTIYFISS